MFKGLFGLGRAYKRLPPHHNFKELADNIDQLAGYLMDRSLGSFANEESWLRKTGQRDKWIFRLTAARIAAHQERS